MEKSNRLTQYNAKPIFGRIARCTIARFNERGNRIIRGENLKDDLILFRCDKEEKQQIKRDAEEHGKCISGYIRYLVAKERKENK